MLCLRKSKVMLVNGRIRPSAPILTRPVPLAIDGHEKRDGRLDRRHFTGVKLTAVPVIRAVRSPTKDIVFCFHIGNCQRTPQSDSHYSCHSCHLRQSLIHPSTQTTEPLPAARDLTVVWPTCPAYVSDLHVRPTWLAYVSTPRVQLLDHIINLIIYLR